MIKNLKYSLAAMGLAMPLVLSGCGGSTEKFEMPETAIQNETLSVSDNDLEVDYTVFSASGETFEIDNKTYIGAHEPVYITNEYKGYSYENGINLNDLFFIRINGEIHLSTKLTDVNEDSIITKYYSLDDGEFLGQTLDINWYSRAIKSALSVFKDSDTSLLDLSINESFLDRNYFNGEYGIGKLLPPEAIIPANKVFSTTELTKKEINELLTEPLKLSAYIENQYVYPTYLTQKKEKYEIVQRYLPQLETLGLRLYCFFAFRAEAETSVISPYKYTLINDEGEIQIIGHRASWNEEDAGYNYVYDVISSKLVDISKYEIKEIEKTVNLSVSDMRTTNMVEHPLEEYYPIDKLKVLYTETLSGDNISELEKYYIITQDEIISNVIYSYNNDVYLDTTYNYNILGEEQDIKINGNYDCSKIDVIKQQNNKSSRNSDYSQYTINLEKCLKENGMNDFIKSTYTQEEIGMLLKTMRGKDLKHLETLAEKIAREPKVEKINLDDIIVIDTTKDNAIVKNTEQRYFIMLPCEIEDKNGLDWKYYQTLDKGATAVYSTGNSFLKIDTIMSTLYAVDNHKEGTLNCLFSLKELLNELELTDMIKDEYTNDELVDLNLHLNEEERKLIFMK